MQRAVTTQEELFQYFYENNCFAPYYPASKGPRHRRGPSGFASPSTWKFETLKQALYDLDRFFPLGQGRRNLTLMNPSLKEIIPSICSTLASGVQMVKPGEVASTHRHYANAFRFVLEAPPQGAYTVVMGVKLMMHPFDIILTPSGTWHDHHNEGASDVIWLDGLDIPLLEWLGVSLYEEDYKADPAGKEEERQRIERSSEDLLAEYGSCLRPEVQSEEKELYNPLFIYRYQEARSAISKQAEKSTSGGVVMEYRNPVKSGPLMPTMNFKLHFVKPQQSMLYQHRNENSVFVGVEGSATVELGGGKQNFNVESKDIVVIPMSYDYKVTNTNSTPLVLFSFSDAPVFKAINQYSGT